MTTTNQRFLPVILRSGATKNLKLNHYASPGLQECTMQRKSGPMKKHQTILSGFSLLNTPRWNKGTAFSDYERDIFELHGLLPPHVGNLDDQIERRMQVLDQQSNAFKKYAFLRDLQDTNETLFYALLVRHLEQLLPLVYTPTVGEGCQRFSEIWRKPRGLFLSYPNKDRIAQILDHPRYDGIRCIVVSDGEDLSTAELIRRTARAFGRSARLLPIPESLLYGAAAIAGRRAEAEKTLGSLRVDISKAKRVLGWEPRVTRAEGLKLTLPYFQEQVARSTRRPAVAGSKRR